MNSDGELAKYIIARFSSMKGERSTWDSLWQDSADYCLPRKAQIVSRQSNPGPEKNAQLFDTTAIYSGSVLANGQLSHITPPDSRWFVYDPPMEMKGIDKVDQWFQKCSEIAQIALATSNFYSSIHELFYDDGIFGTYALFVVKGKNNILNFRNVEIGTFCIAENSDGYVDTLFYEWEFTCRQAAQEFGKENLSPRLQKEVDESYKNGTYPDKKHKFIHAIYPREDNDRDASKKDGPNKPYASVWVDVESQYLTRNEGFDEQPFFSGRHLKWGRCVYGWAPSWMALPEARQLNFLSKQLDALAEIKAFPRILIPDTHEGQVNLRAGGITYFDPNLGAAIPREWATQGDYQIGLERERRKQERIEQAFHVDLFRMFSGIDKQMTAREVAERSSEKLVQFTPTFARKTTELLNPMLRRVFALLVRSGAFPPPPKEALAPDPITGQPYLPEPDITYTSRVALAIKAMQNVALARTFELIAPFVQIKPEIMDNYDFDKISRDAARNDGLPSDWITAQDKVEEIRKARAEAQAQLEQQQQAMAMAEAASKAGSIKNDSALASMLEQAE